MVVHRGLAKSTTTEGRTMAQDGRSEWARVLYRPMAEAIRDRLNAENPRYRASIGLLSDDTYIVWYHNQHKPR